MGVWGTRPAARSSHCHHPQVGVRAPPRVAIPPASMPEGPAAGGRARVRAGRRGASQRAAVATRAAATRASIVWAQPARPMRCAMVTRSLDC